MGVVEASVVLTMGVGRGTRTKPSGPPVVSTTSPGSFVSDELAEDKVNERHCESMRGRKRRRYLDKTR